MVDEKDNIQQAADALDALQNLGQPAQQDGAQPAEHELPPELTSTTQPAVQSKGAAPAPKNTAARITIKKVAKIVSLKSDKPKQKRVTPPPVLTPLQKAQRTGQVEFRRTAVPLLLTMGLTMVVLACWSAGVLVWNVDFFHPRAEIGPNTTYLAKLALLAWPIALILLIGAGFFIYDVYTWFTMYPPEPRTPRKAPPAAPPPEV